MASDGRPSPRGNGSSYEDRQALEVELANMETRLRSALTELMQPTIQRTTNLVADLEHVKNQVLQHTRGLQEVQLGQFKVMEQMSTIATFKDEMSKWDVARTKHETTLNEKSEAMMQKLDAFKYSLEQKESALHHLHRSVDRMATELNHLLEEQDTSREALESRIDEQSRKANQLRSEIDVRIAGLELKHNALTDELWSEETGLAKVAGELKKTNAVFGELEAQVAALHEGKAEAAQLDRLRADVGKMVHEANTSVGAMRQTVGNVVNDVREHFRTASQTIAAHNATFVGEVREQYQQELANAAKLREEVQGFMSQVADRIDGLDARVAGAASKADALAGEAREEIEELNRRRKSDKSASDTELKALKKRLGGVFENSDMVLRGIEHIYKIMGMILESDLIQCSVELQDNVDRQKIALLGVKDTDTMLNRTCMQEPQRPRPECRTKGGSGQLVGYPPGGAGGGGNGGGSTTLPGKLRGGPGTMGSAFATGGSKAQQPVVRVDNRCLSCSGQSPLVLSAFKMACLQYSPSPVDHEGMQHDRADLLNSRHELLQDAHEALLDGPGGGGGGTSAAGSATGGISGGGSLDGAGSDGGGAFAEYAAVEARHSQQGGQVVRLPTLPSGALTAR